MKGMIHALRRTLNAVDPWLEIIFPISTALICARQRTAGYSLLAIFLFLRLLKRCEEESWNWILISILILNSGLIIQDQDLKPGGPSDYLIVALSLSAGIGRSELQWKRSVFWMTSCIVPLLFFSLQAADKMIIGNSSFAGFNINKIAFLAGLTTILAYGHIKQSAKTPAQVFPILFFFAGIWEAWLSGSRAAMAAPAIAIAIDYLRSLKWTPARITTTCAIGVSTVLAIIHLWYGDFSLKSNALSDLNRIETVRCWTEQTLDTPNGLVFGAGFNNTPRSECGPDRIPSLALMQKREGLGHAHNLYAQIFSETGLPGLLLFTGLTVAAIVKGWIQRTSEYMRFTFPLVCYLFLMALGITFWQVMMINQVLVGYSLAALTAKESGSAAASAATPPTQPI
jgi:hypothetical protein